MKERPPGDCFSRCLCELSGEPYIRSEWPDLPDKTEQAWRAYQEELAAFLGRHGWALIVFDHLAENENRDKANVTLNATFFGPTVPVVSVAGGLRHNGERHAVVMNGEELVYDPHPEGTGLATIEDLWFLVPVDPARFFDLEAEPPDLAPPA